MKRRAVLQAVDRAVPQRRMHRGRRPTAVPDDAFEKPITMVGRSPAIRQVQDVIQRVADTRATVLITGETGVGKELVAQALHAQSLRRKGPFIAVDCACVSAHLPDSVFLGHERGAFSGAKYRRRGTFEQAHRGTVFLDEVASLSHPAQGVLLRAIPDGAFMRVGGGTILRVDVRVVATTNQDLRQLVADGAFRTELFYRLDVVPIHVPPLRERQDDIALLVTHFLNLYSRAYERRVQGMTEGALARLRHYPWPGNVRELEHLIVRLVATSTQALCGLSDLEALDFPEYTAT